MITIKPRPLSQLSKGDAYTYSNHNGYPLSMCIWYKGSYNAALHKHISISHKVPNTWKYIKGCIKVYPVADEDFARVGIQRRSWEEVRTPYDDD